LPLISTSARIEVRVVMVPLRIDRIDSASGAGRFARSTQLELSPKSIAGPAGPIEVRPWASSTPDICDPSCLVDRGSSPQSACIAVVGPGILSQLSIQPRPAWPVCRSLRFPRTDSYLDNNLWGTFVLPGGNAALLLRRRPPRWCFCRSRASAWMPIFAAERI